MRVLAVIDVYTRECVAFARAAAFVAMTWCGYSQRPCKQRGGVLPEVISVDNGRSSRLERWITGRIGTR